jgi:TonB family protein
MDPLTLLLQTHSCLAIAFAGYWWTMRQETWFTARRAWLIGAIALSMVLPWASLWAPPQAVLAITLPTFTTGNEAQTATGIPWTSLLVGVHITVSGLLLLRLLIRAWLALRLVRGPVQQACSFLGTVAIPTQVDADDARAMRIHEETHARHRHSLDILLMESCAAVWWSNPLWPLIRRELKLVHELAADAEACKVHDRYDELLLAHALNTSRATLAHHFGTSHVRTRITMLYNTRPRSSTRRKLWFALPTVILALAMVSWDVVPVPSRIGPLAQHIDQQPEFPGGQEALMKYLGSNIAYPSSAQEAKVEGTVIIGFLVKADGAVTQVTVKRGVHQEIDAEAVRVVAAMPRWNPAKAHGKPVDAEMTLPIAFRLTDK